MVKVQFQLVLEGNEDMRSDLVVTIIVGGYSERLSTENVKRF